MLCYRCFRCASKSDSEFSTRDSAPLLPNLLDRDSEVIQELRGRTGQLLAHFHFSLPAVPCPARRSRRPVPDEEAIWQSAANAPTNCTAFERTSKRRKGYPSETRVKRGLRVVHGDKELMEKLGRNDLCPCGSGRRFQALLPQAR